MKDNRQVVCAVIIAIGIAVAGLFISNGIVEGFVEISRSIYSAAEILR